MSSQTADGRQFVMRSCKD